MTTTSASSCCIIHYNPSGQSGREEDKRDIPDIPGVGAQKTRYKHTAGTIDSRHDRRTPTNPDRYFPKYNNLAPLNEFVREKKIVQEACSQCSGVTTALHLIDVPTLSCGARQTYQCTVKATRGLPVVRTVNRAGTAVLLDSLRNKEPPCGPTVECS